MNTQTVKSDALLLLTALIWGCAFVAQRVGMDYVGPFTFNGARFVLGSLVLLPLILRSGTHPKLTEVLYKPSFKRYFWGGLFAGSMLFAGASMQQVGMLYTTAGNAGFITGLYVVIVPILGLVLFRKGQGLGAWIGAALAVAGLYLLSVQDDFSMNFGDLLQLIGAFFWAGHVVLIGVLSPKTNPLKLAFAQYVICAILSLLTALCLETISLSGLTAAAMPIFYGGAISVGVAYTLQIVAQQHAQPAHAAILLSMESVFAALAGWAMLDETMSKRAVVGCGLMLTGMLVSQLLPMLRKKRSPHTTL